MPSAWPNLLATRSTTGSWRKPIPQPSFCIVCRVTKKKSRMRSFTVKSRSSFQRPRAIECGRSWLPWRFNRERSRWNELVCYTPLARGDETTGGSMFSTTSSLRSSTYSGSNEIHEIETCLIYCSVCSEASSLFCRRTTSNTILLVVNQLNECIGDSDGAWSKQKVGTHPFPDGYDSAVRRFVGSIQPCLLRCGRTREVAGRALATRRAVLGCADIATSQLYRFLDSY